LSVGRNEVYIKNICEKDRETTTHTEREQKKKTQKIT